MLVPKFTSDAIGRCLVEFHCGSASKSLFRHSSRAHFEAWTTSVVRPYGAHDEFTLDAIAQNLRRLALSHLATEIPDFCNKIGTEPMFRDWI